jgi:serine/threonine-protein kinase RsbW
MSSERVMEGLLLSELVARNSLRYLIGDTVSVHIDVVEEGFELRVGPLEDGGAQAVIDDSQVPVVGSVLERLADDVRVDHGDEGESITLRMNPRG